jgi:hypothetical protein
MFTTIDQVKDGDAIHVINDGYTIVVHEVRYEKESKYFCASVFRVKGVVKTPYLKKDGQIGVHEREFDSTIDTSVALVKVDNK